jgi:peptide/nickel transport system substrate-binding protein
MRPISRASVGCLGLVLLLSACAPRPGVGDGQSNADQASSARERPTLTLAIPREPSIFNWELTTASEISNGLTLIKQIPHNQLMAPNDRGGWVPMLAAEQTSFEAGTWRLNPDGSMDTTWKLRPNVRWQDGAPFTSDDLVFSFGVYKDPDVLNKERSTYQLMESATAPDPQTFVIHWSQPYRLADQMGRVLDPLPRHLIERPYQTDKEALPNSSLLREDFVGLGAYRLTSWEPGSHLEFTPFDDYYLGRPPLGRVVVKIVPDVNTIVANILAGSTDVMLNLELSMGTALEVRDRWQGTGNQVQFFPRESPYWLEVQHRPDIARPVNGLTNRTVRQAFLQGIDREAVVQSLTAGFGQVADSWIHPDNVDRSELAPSIPQYPYDPQRAQQLLAEAGWIRGPGGVLTNQANGDAFRIETRFDVDADSEKLMTIVADYWSALGAQPSITALTPALKNDNEFRARFSGAHGRAAPGFPDSLVSQLHSKFQASPETKWIGGRTGYSNAQADELLDRFAGTIEPQAQRNLQKGLLQELIGDIAMMPMYWPVEPNLEVKGVNGPRGRDGWNFHEWTKQ